ncbi:hypothetical protein LCGC14_2367430 [marine sediment metagenome]|uniref:Uncharacterized protein n=1 Tax=marine sediment metagenome TaxID=412755 RepID=A0A0F9CS25_9ZZZZ
MEITSTYECPKCKAILKYETETRKYKCDNCHTEFDTDTITKSMKKRNAKQNNRKAENNRRYSKKKEAETMAKKGKCTSCGRDNMSIQAKGLCGTCYAKQRVSATGSKKAPIKNPKLSNKTKPQRIDQDDFINVSAEDISINELAEAQGFIVISDIGKVEVKLTFKVELIDLEKMK